MNILIAYYSWSGNTEQLAQIIQQKTGGRLFRIRPEEEYSENYSACLKRGREEIRGGIMPELQEMPDDLSSIDTLFIGSPNWCSTMAPPVLTFLTRGIFHGIRIIPFLSHGGGGAGHFVQDIARACPGAVIADDLELYGTSGSERGVSELLQRAGFN